MKLQFGTEQVTENGQVVISDKHYRSILKGICWRIVGSLDTFWIALVINGDAPKPVQTAFYIAATEVLTKVGLFWLHERIWIKVKWGAQPLPVMQAQ